MTILHLLDADIISALARNPRGSVAKHIAKVGADTVGVGVVTADEPRYGCAKEKSRKPAAQIEVILSTLTILALDVPQTPNMAGFARNLRLLARQLGQTIF